MDSFGPKAVFGRIETSSVPQTGPSHLACQLGSKILLNTFKVGIFSICLKIKDRDYSGTSIITCTSTLKVQCICAHKYFHIVRHDNRRTKYK